MSLKTFKWNNGSIKSPIILTDEDIQTLISAKDKVDNYEISGYITTTTGNMYKFIKTTLNNLFPNLHIIKAGGESINELADEFTITVDNPIIDEGKSSIIKIIGGTITHDYLNYHIEFITPNDQIITNGNINPDIIKNRIKIQNGFIKIDPPEENAEWKVDMKITAYPKYYEGTPLNEIPEKSKPTIDIRAQAISISNIEISIPEEIAILSEIPITIIPIPSNSTKLSGAIYEYTTNTPNYISVINNNPKTLNNTTTVDSLANIIVSMRLSYLGNIIASTSFNFSIFNLRPTCYIIDQRYITTLDSDSMVSNNFYINDEGIKVNLKANASVDSATENTIKWIRDNSHLYVGQWDGNNMKLKQLSDTNKTKFADGTSAEQYITGNIDDNAYTYDVWLKFKTDIYVKTESYIPDNSEIKDSNYVKVEISKDIPKDYSENNPNGWFKYDKNHLIGVYKMSLKNNKGRSISGVVPVTNITSTNTLNKTTVRGLGMGSITYNAHKIMSYLCYGYYGTLNPNNICGKGTNNIINNVTYPKITGICNILGMTDTTHDNNDYANCTGTNVISTTEESGINEIKAGIGPNLKSINFWGLENWWGDTYECMSNLWIMEAKNPKQPTDSNYSFSPKAYLDDYITQYKQSHPEVSGVIVTKDGIDITITSDDIQEYDAQHKFIKITNIQTNEIIRIIQTSTKTAFYNHYIRQMCFGNHADTTYKTTIPLKVTESGFKGKTGIGNLLTWSIRGGNSNDGNINALSITQVYGESSISSRIYYEGTDNTIEIVDNF